MNKLKFTCEECGKLVIVFKYKGETITLRTCKHKDSGILAHISAVATAKGTIGLKNI